jgi:hypothetical protein
MIKEKVLGFIKSTFSEADGSGSASRVLSGMVVLSTIVWVSYLVIKTTALPDLTSAAIYVGAGFSGYGVNKLSRALRNDKDEQ